MYQTIMVPVDLAHVGKLGHAIEVAGDLARHWNAQLIFVGVTADSPGALGKTPGEYETKLKAFAADHAASAGHAASAHMVVSNDPAAELEDALIKATHDTGADLVVMASHIPGLKEHFWPSNGGRLATQARISVFVVRD